MDGWLLDLPLVPTVFQLLLDPSFHARNSEECVETTALQTIPKMLWHLRTHVDPRLGGLLTRLHEVGEQHADTPEKQLTLDGSKIEDLCLDFTLPGHPDIHLVPVSPSVPALFNF